MPFDSAPYPLPKISVQTIIARADSMTVKEAKRLTGGGLQRGNSKMPSLTYGTSAKGCLIGQRLQKIAGSICEECYALKGNYRFPDVAKGLLRRLQAVRSDDLTPWASAMVKLINRYAKADKDFPGKRFFRFHDSGDLQSLEHFQAICLVAQALPDVSIWLPTRELGLLRKADKLGIIPPNNLVVGVSQHFVGRHPWQSLPSWARSSTVNWEAAPNNCPAYLQGGACSGLNKETGAYNACRKCWDPSAFNTNYPLH